jgi:hypothetical protein
MHDIVLVLTGTTSVGSLSAHVDSVNTFLSAAYTSAGLTLVDPCASSLGTVTFSNVGGNLTMNKGTTALLFAGMPVTIHGGVAPTGTVDNTTYYVCTVGLTTAACTFSTTYANAMAGVPITYIDAGSGTIAGWSGLIQVISVPVYDGGVSGTDVNYIIVYGASNYVTLGAAEGWNTNTHIGTNTIAPASNSGYVGSNAGGIFTIGAATAFSIYANGYSATVTGNATYVSFVSQKVRTSAWDTPSAGYPTITPVAFNNVSVLGAPTRTIVGGPATYSIPFNTAANTYYPNAKVKDGVGGFYAPLNDVAVGQNSTGGAVALGSLSTWSDIWGSITYPASYDEISVGGKTYVYLQGSILGAIPGICVPKG